jgi:light-regulated signal transduction histidine kinase (bacteriophytochrome)
MNTIVHGVFNELKTSSFTEIDFQCEKLADAYGDESLIRQIWTNLISNAIKYSAQRESISITINYRKENKSVVYFIRDNGVGFDMKYAPKLFGVFQRLHSLREFDGTGVGLAIVKRIVQRMGGKVWAEGIVNNGATFYFSLPA